jgi:hypothetical protein
MVWPQLFKRAAFVSLLIAMGCNKDFELPTNPPPPQGTGGIGGYIFAGTDGNCLVGARVELVDGPRAGEVIQQSDCPFGDGYGYYFQNLPLNTRVTFRASAPGYKTAVNNAYPQIRVGQTNFILNRE